MRLEGRHGRAAREHGAVAVIVSVLLATGVVMGSLALSVDIGQIMSERRQLQNGADASAMALAQLCGKSDPTCAATTATSPGNDPAASAVKPLANANANDQREAISNVCASQVTTIPVTCEAGDASTLTKCGPKPGWLVSGIPYVEVKTSTETASGGSTILTPFARALTGTSGGTSVTACARSAWGPPGDYTAKVPVVVSECEWIRNTSSGTVYQTGPAGPAPGYGTASGQTPWPTAASAEIIIYLKSTSDTPCAINGKDTSGGFGYVDDVANNCAAAVSIAGWAEIKTGSSPPTGCDTAIAAARGTVIDLPIFDCLVKQNAQPTGPISGYSDCTGDAAGGAKSWYHVAGWAKFYLTGFKISGGVTPSLRTGLDPCANGDRCLSGWYVTGTLTGAGTIVPPTPGNNFGASLVLPAG